MTSEKNQRKNIQRDLKRLDDEIARSRRMAEFHAESDIELVDAYTQDANDLQAIRDAASRGDLAEAGRLAYDLDTYVRDEIPKRLFNAIMKANGTNS